MLLIDKYLIREMTIPFFISLLIITFLLFINFLLRAIDRFLGKGLEFLTILEYLILNLAWIVALSVPMAVLLATLATFGKLSEDNEINAMRSTGIGFITILRAPLIFGTIIAILLIIFNNIILPEMNFKARLLSGDIYKKRPDISIEPGIFVDNIPGYNMIISEKKNGIMYDIRILSKGQNKSQTTIHSDSGKITTMADAFLLTLFDGEIHELENKDYTNYRRIIFEEHKIIIPANDILLNRRDSSNRTDREMTIPMILDKIASYDNKIKVVSNRIKGSFSRTVGDSILPKNIEQGSLLINKTLKLIKNDSSLFLGELNKKERQLRNLERQLKNEMRLISSYSKGVNKYRVEAHKKFSIPFACILFVLLGAPLGILANKGGFAVSTSISFGFFLMYYILLIIGEELADRNILSPLVGMWTPNVVLMIVSIYLIFYTIREGTSKTILSFIRKSRSF